MDGQQANELRPIIEAEPLEQEAQKAEAKRAVEEDGLREQVENASIRHTKGPAKITHFVQDEECAGTKRPTHSLPTEDQGPQGNQCGDQPLSCRVLPARQPQTPTSIIRGDLFGDSQAPRSNREAPSANRKAPCANCEIDQR